MKRLLIVVCVLCLEENLESGMDITQLVSRL